jgi:hypothetical protein
MRKSARPIAADGGRFPCRHWRTRSERRNSIPDRDAFPLTASPASVASHITPAPGPWPQVTGCSIRRPPGAKLTCDSARWDSRVRGGTDDRFLSSVSLPILPRHSRLCQPAWTGLSLSTLPSHRLFNPASPVALLICDSPAPCPFGPRPRRARGTRCFAGQPHNPGPQPPTPDSQIIQSGAAGGPANPSLGS